MAAKKNTPSGATARAAKPPGRRRKPPMKHPHIAVIELPPLPTNCYIVHDGAQALVIDPGGPPEAVARYLQDRKLHVTHILLTHLHSDHTVGAGPLARAFAAPVRASAKDGWMLDDYLGRGDDDWGIPPVAPFSFTDLPAGELPVLHGGCTVLETPGHSPGGLSFYFGSLGAVFSGDTLFRRCAGRTDFSGGSPADLQESLEKTLFRLPGATRVFPGHGKSFTLDECALFTEFSGKKG